MRVPHAGVRVSSVLLCSGRALWTLLPHPLIIRKDAQTPIRRNAGRAVLAVKLLAGVNPPLLDARADRQSGEDLHPKTFRLRASADQEMGCFTLLICPGQRGFLRSPKTYSKKNRAVLQTQLS